MRRSSWGTWALGLFLIGCGEQSIEPVNGGAAGGSGGSTGGRTGAGGAATGGRGASGSTAGGGGGQAGADAGAFDPPIMVSAQQIVTGGDSWAAAANGMLQPDPQKRCYSHLVAGCVVTDCRVSKYGTGGIVGADLGAVTVGSAMGDSVLTPDADNLFAPVAANGVHWNAGDDVPIHSAGGVLPAFSVTLKMPGAVKMLSMPAVDLDTSTPLALSWSATDGDVILSLGQSVFDNDFDYLDVLCTFPGEAGKGTIPVQALQSLEPGQQTWFWAIHSALQEVPVGDRIVWAMANAALGKSVTPK
jgi:hypothetical protein